MAMVLVLLIPREGAACRRLLCSCFIGACVGPKARLWSPGFGVGLFGEDVIITAGLCKAHWALANSTGVPGPMWRGGCIGTPLHPRAAAVCQDPAHNAFRPHSRRRRIPLAFTLANFLPCASVQTGKAHFPLPHLQPFHLS